MFAQTQVPGLARLAQEEKKACREVKSSWISVQLQRKGLPSVLNQQQVELECKAHNLLAAVKAGLTQAVPKQQWRPVSEDELACTAASAQSWVHAYVIQKAAH